MGHIKFEKENDEMILDPPRDNLQVIDVDLQGTANFYLWERFQKEFPETYKIYSHMCLKRAKNAGDIFITQERGHKICLLFTINNRANKRDNRETVIKNTIECLTKLMQKTDRRTVFSSGIINRHTGTWIEIAKHIHKLHDVNWVVHSK